MVDINPVEPPEKIKDVSLKKQDPKVDEEKFKKTYRVQSVEESDEKQKKKQKHSQESASDAEAAAAAGLLGQPQLPQHAHIEPSPYSVQPPSSKTSSVGGVTSGKHSQHTGKSYSPVGSAEQATSAPINLPTNTSASPPKSTPTPPPSSAQQPPQTQQPTPTNITSAAETSIDYQDPFELSGNDYSQPLSLSPVTPTVTPQDQTTQDSDETDETTNTSEPTNTQTTPPTTTNKQPSSTKEPNLGIGITPYPLKQEMAGKGKSEPGLASKKTSDLSVSKDPLSGAANPSLKVPETNDSPSLEATTSSPNSQEAEAPPSLKATTSSPNSQEAEAPPSLDVPNTAANKSSMTEVPPPPLNLNKSKVTDTSNTASLTDVAGVPVSSNESSDQDTKDDSDESQDIETMQAMQGNIQTPTPFLTDTSSVASTAPAYTTLSPALLEMFDKMVGTISVLQETQGERKTTVTLTSPNFSSSVFYGAEIVIEEDLHLAPGQYNIKLIGSPEAVNLFQSKQNDLMAAFQSGSYNFRVQRLETAIQRVDKPLFQRKDGVDNEGSGEGDQGQQDRQKDQQ